MVPSFTDGWTERGCASREPGEPRETSIVCQETLSTNHQVQRLGGPRKRQSQHPMNHRPSLLLPSAMLSSSRTAFSLYASLVSFSFYRIQSSHHVEEIGICGLCQNDHQKNRPRKDNGCVNVPKGWLQLSCGFCVYFCSNSSRMLFNNWT